MVLLTALGVNFDAAVASTALVRVTTFWFAVGIGVCLLPAAIRAASRSAEIRLAAQPAARHEPLGRTRAQRLGPSAQGRCLAARPERQTELAAAFASEGRLLAFGAGRSYGDVALNSGGRAVITTRLDRLLSL